MIQTPTFYVALGTLAFLVIAVGVAIVIDKVKQNKKLKID